MSYKVKQPTGLTITRSGSKFKATWKEPEAYARTKYHWGYQKNGKFKWLDGHKTSTKRAELTISGNVEMVAFRVCGFGLPGHAIWSAETIKKHYVYAPYRPTITANFVQTAMTTFTWNMIEDKNHDRPTSSAKLQTILVQDCPSGEKALASLKQWKTATTTTVGVNGSITPVNGAGEDTGLISGKSYTRVVRVKEIGFGGESNWRYATHIYAAPYAATNVEGTVTKTEASLNCNMTWQTPTDAGHPIDKNGVVPEWAIATPDAGMECPDDASWESLPAQASTSGTEAKQFTIDTPIGADKCLFLRVVTIHDNDEVQSNAVLAKGDSVGPLIPPEFTEAPAITSSTVTIKATNESAVDDSFVVDFLEREDGSVEVLGLHDTSTKVYQVTGIENARVGIKAYVGTWNSTTKEVENVLMESPMVWSAGNVPVAPSLSDFNVEQSIVPNTVLVSWDYSWSDADACEISWSTEPDAWISTEDPESYVVLRGLENKLAIKGVEAGIPLYVRIRYLDGVDEEAILSPYSDIKNITISTVPAIPTLNLEKQFFTQGEEVNCSWIYVTTDGTEQAQAQIAERIVTTEGGETVISYELLKEVATEQKTVIENTWEVGTQHSLAVRVANGSGNWSEWSEAVVITIAEPITCEITETSLVYDEIPINPETYTGNPITFDSGEQEKDVVSLDVELLPIQAGTPWQSSQQTTPYTYHSTPQLGHSYNSVLPSLVGGSVAWNQLIQNGNFADTSHWALANATGFSATNNIGSFTATAQYGGITGSFSAISGHKCFAVAQVKISSGSAQVLFGGSSVAQKTTTITGAFETLFAVFDPAYTGAYLFPRVRDTRTSGWDAIEVKNVMLIDLTQMFGTAIADAAYTKEQNQAGSGIAWLRSYGFFTEPYYPYTAGSIESSCVSARTATGFNQWDEEWEVGGIVNATGLPYNANDRIRSKNYCPCLPSTTYYGCTDFQIYFYTSNHDYISYTGTLAQGSTFTTPNNAKCFKIVKQGITTYGNDICINISNADVNGQYEPYHEESYVIDNTELNGLFKLDGDSIYCDGDEYKADGSVTRKYGSVDLGTLSWVPNGAITGGIQYACTTLSTKAVGKTNFICPNYVTGTPRQDLGYICGRASTPTISINSTITDSDQFVTSLSGVYLIYELATSTTDTADPYDTPQYADPYGTEWYTDGLTRDVQVPMGQKSTYADIYPITGYDNTIITDSNGTDTTTTTVNLPHTVYGADVDVTGGESKETWQNIASYNGETISEPWLSSMDEYVQGATPTTGAQVCYELATPTDLQTTPTDVELLTGVNNISADGDMTLTIVDDIEKGDYLKSLPMTATVTGAGTGGRTTLMIARRGDYRIERPEGEDFKGHDGEVVYQNVYPGEAQQEIQLEDLQGDLDDGARYIIRASIEDDYGQSDSDEIEFTVNWDHKAIKPSATVVVTDIAKITIAESEDAEESDYVDIYRQSVDGTELIYTGANFGETYVDPYPTIGNFGYLIVGRNAYGDFIMEESTGDHGQFAWYDLPAGYESERTLIDFDGEQIQLFYNVDVSHSWNKDFKKTKYLGGSIVGDYVAGVERTANVNAVSVPILESSMLESMRRLAKYEGNCHVRTKEGSSFTAAIQVSEDDNHDKAGFVRSFSISVEKVEPVELDGMTEDEWEAQDAVEQGL